MDFQDDPAQSRMIPWKLILIIGGGVLVAAGIIWGIVLFTHRTPQLETSKTISSSNSGKDVSTSPTSVEQCESVPNPDACKNTLAKQDAITKKDTKVCDALPAITKDDCILGVVRAANDPSLCSRLSNKDDVRLCSNRIQTMVAVAASDDAMCDKITDEEGKKNCHESVLATVTVANCKERKQDLAYCTLLETIESATKALDRDLCNVLKDSDSVTNCRSRIVLDDPVHDGLSTEQETEIYHTDPRNADTDGDGYTDGSEVASGHDPLKK